MSKSQQAMEKELERLRSLTALMPKALKAQVKFAKLPLWRQFAKISAKRTIQDGERAARQYLTWLKSIEDKPEEGSRSAAG